MSSHLMVRDHGSSDEGQEFQGTVAAEQAPVRTFTRKHILEQRITSYTAAFAIFWEPQALFVNLGQLMSCCSNLLFHLSLDTDRNSPGHKLWQFEMLLLPWMTHPQHRVLLLCVRDKTTSYKLLCIISTDNLLHTGEEKLELIGSCNEQSEPETFILSHHSLCLAANPARWLFRSPGKP